MAAKKEEVASVETVKPIWPTYQLPEMEMKTHEFKNLPLRDDHTVHDATKVYRTMHGYPNDAFVWVPIADNEDCKGEWHRAPVKFTD